METYDVTQVLMAVRTFHEVRELGKPDVLITIKGELVTAAPKFTMREGTAGPELASLVGNMMKTRFSVMNTDQREVAQLVFPIVAFKKTLTLTVGERQFAADGGFFKGQFTCAGPDGVVLEIKKELSIRDKFTVTFKEPITKDVALLSAVAIHSRFFELT
jgi:uncharacterized protein YxjI